VIKQLRNRRILAAVFHVCIAPFGFLIATDLSSVLDFVTCSSRPSLAAQFFKTRPGF
jgi:hypothetical protein